MAKQTQNRRNWLKFLRDFFDDAEERTQQACVDALNEAADTVVKNMGQVFDEGRVVSRTGRLRGSLGNYTRAKVVGTTKGKKLLHAAIHTDKDTEVTAKNPGSRNPKMKNRYPASYGRIIEFSKRLNPNGERDFFYGPWYDSKKQVEQDIKEKIFDEWSK